MNVPCDPHPVLPDFLDKRRQNLTFDLGWDRHVSAPQWSARLHQAWIKTLPPHHGPAKAQLAGDDITLSFATGATTQGRFWTPKGAGPYPAILLCHDHGGRFDIGWRKMCNDPASADTRANLYDGVAVAEAFVDAGFAVLCVDALGWGARQTGGYAGQQALAANAMGLGWSLAGLVASEDIQAATWLATQPNIDPRQIGAFGFSFGGFRAWQVAALCRAITAAGCASWMACKADIMAPNAPLLKGQSAFYMLHPQIADRADFPDMAGLATDKPLFLRSGHGDPHMPEHSVKKAFDHITQIAQACGGPVPNTGWHDAAHRCPASVTQAAIEFFKSS